MYFNMTIISSHINEKGEMRNREMKKRSTIKYTVIKISLRSFDLHHTDHQ